MAHAQTKLGQDPQYERFLHASAGQDSRGSSVTVLSMLARLGVDPWGEASDLATLPEAAAQRKLEAMMARSGDLLLSGPERGRVVAGLLAFLPRRKMPAPAPAGATTAQPAFLPIGKPIHWIFAALLILGLIAMLAQGH